MARKGEDFYELYAKNVYRYLFSLIGEADTAEELTQETFYQALKNMDAYRGDSTPQVWLCAIAKRLWFKELDRRSRTACADDSSFSHMAAILSAIVALSCMWWLYDQEFHYANTEAGRLAAVCDYIPLPEDSTMPYGVKAGTPLRVAAWQTMENHLFLFFGADNKENVHGIMHLVRGVNGKYRAIESWEEPSQYSAGVYGESLTPKGTDWKLFMLAGDNCRDIYSAEVHYVGIDYDGVHPYTAVKTYALSDSNFLWIMERSELEQELGFADKDILGLHIEEVRLLDKNGEDITGQYKDESMTASWGGGKGTAELFLLYVYMGVAAVLGVVFIRYFLRRD